MVLQTTEKVSTLAYLRTLQAARVCIGQLVDELKAHGLTEHPNPLSSTTTVVIDQNLEELFLPYLSGSSYIDREKVSLDQLYAGVLLKFNLFHVCIFFLYQNLFLVYSLFDWLTVWME